MRDSRREELFTQWLVDHRGIVVKVARSFTSTHADTDDLIQEILLRLWTSMDAYRGDAKSSTWIYRVALNRALTWRRGSNRRPAESPPDSLRHMAAPTNAEDQYRLNLLYQHIRQLSKIDRSLILLSLDGFSYAEMSAIAGISESNVGARLTRARTALSTMIAEASR